MQQKIRVATALLSPIFLDTDATTEKACQAILEAGENGAQLVALPETFIPTYPFWASRLDVNTFQHRFDRRLFEQAVVIPSPITDRLADAAKKAGCYAVVGMTEREGGTLYNTQLFLGPDGTIMGKRRKLMPTRYERMIWGQGDGTDLQVFPTEIGVLGGLICFEHTNALYRYALQAQGEQIHIAVWPGGMKWRHVIDAAIRHYAFEAQAFVINATALLSAELIAELGEGGALGELAPGGGYAAIVGPDGHYLAGPEQEKEGLLYADLDLGQIAERKMWVDSAGHYARPDVVRLVVNRKAQKPLVFEE